MNGQGIRFGVSMFSYSSEYYLYRQSIDDILRNVKEAGGEGIEIVASQMIPGYPYPDKEWLHSFRDKCEKMELDPFCYSAHLDSGLRSDRFLTPDELLDCTINDLRCAAEMGASVVRTQQTITPALIAKIVPWAKRYGVKLSVELHPPHRLSTPVWLDFVRAFREAESEYVGITLDLGIYQEFPYDGWLSAYTSEGVRQDTVNFVLNSLAVGRSETEVLRELRNRNAGAYADEMASEIYSLYAPYKPDALADVLRYVTHFHSKFYHMIDGEEPTIPYRKLLRILKDNDYHGFLISEYEGHYTYDPDRVSCTEQIREHIKMEKRILSELQDEKG